MGTETQREFYSYHRGQILTDTEDAPFDVAAWMGSAIKTIDTAHDRTHRGQTFAAYNNSASLANGSAINIYFETGASSAPHLIIDVHAKFDYDFEILEAPTVTSSTGTDQIIYNKNRQSATTSLLTSNDSTLGSCSVDVTVTADGTQISHDTVSSGHKMGGNATYDDEWVLDVSTKYVFRLTSRANSNRAHINLNWYEPT